MNRILFVLAAWRAGLRRALALAPTAGAPAAAPKPNPRAHLRPASPAPLPQASATPAPREPNPPAPLSTYAVAGTTVPHLRQPIQQLGRPFPSKDNL